MTGRKMGKGKAKARSSAALFLLNCEGRGFFCSPYAMPPSILSILSVLIFYAHRPLSRSSSDNFQHFQLLQLPNRRISLSHRVTVDDGL